MAVRVEMNVLGAVKHRSNNWRVNKSLSPMRGRELVVRSSVNGSHAVMTLQGRCSVHGSHRQPSGLAFASMVLGREMIRFHRCSSAGPDLGVALHLLGLLERLHGIHESVNGDALGGEISHHGLHASKLKHVLPHFSWHLVQHMGTRRSRTGSRLDRELISFPPTRMFLCERGVFIILLPKTGSEQDA